MTDIPTDDDGMIPVRLSDIDAFSDACFQRGLFAGLMMGGGLGFTIGVGFATLIERMLP